MMKIMGETNPWEQMSINYTEYSSGGNSSVEI